MSPRDYIANHPVLRLDVQKFEHSPFIERYVTDDTVFGVYSCSGRLFPLSIGADALADYEQLCSAAALFDVPQQPVQIEGPDAERLLDRLFVCDVASLPPGRARYAIACEEHGGLLMDGILIRLEPERFWYAMADGDFLGWLRAHALGLDVAVGDPKSWVAAIQGPRSLDVLAAACDEAPPEPFPYFGVARVRMGGQDVLITRTGWSGELGFEVYTERGIDGGALWDHVVAAGTPLGMGVQGLDSLGIRRIEAGILDNTTDMNVTMTPFAAGLGRFVNLDKPSFIGREALLDADRRTRLFGVSCESVTPESGMAVNVEGSRVGVVTIGAWSPRLRTGIGYARMREPGATGGMEVTLGTGGAPARLVDLPFVDPERRIPRGLPLADGDLTGA